MKRNNNNVVVKATKKECDDVNIVCSPKDVLGKKRNDNKNYTDLIY